MKNVDKGIHMTVAAKLREKGVPANRADTIATSNAAAARKIFDAHVKSAGGFGESAIESGLSAVSAWAAKL
jgi:hypothetical protein